MSLKTRSEHSRWPPRRAPEPTPRLRVLPLLVASKASACPGRSLDTIRRQTIANLGDVARRNGCRSRIPGRNDKTAAATSAYLTAFATGISRLVGGPFVGSTLFMRGASALTGDFALLLGRHRS